MYTQHGTLLLFVLFSQPIYKDTKSRGTKVARKLFSMRKQAWLNCKQIMLYFKSGSIHFSCQRTRFIQGVTPQTPRNFY